MAKQPCCFTAPRKQREKQLENMRVLLIILRQASGGNGNDHFLLLPANKGVYWYRSEAGLVERAARKCPIDVKEKPSEQKEFEYAGVIHETSDTGGAAPYEAFRAAVLSA